MESSSSLIMGVIRILSNSKDDAERDVIRKKLEDCLDASDQKLTKLVSEHHKDLRCVMSTFLQTANNLQSSLAKLKQAKKRLKDSSDMLTARLNELMRLSEELANSEKMIGILDQKETSTLDETKDTTLNETEDEDLENTLLENNVFNPRTTTQDSALFKFSRSSYAICFEEHFKELSI